MRAFERLSTDLYERLQFPISQKPSRASATVLTKIWHPKDNELVQSPTEGKEQSDDSKVLFVMWEEGDCVCSSDPMTNVVDSNGLESRSMYLVCPEQSGLTFGYKESNVRRLMGQGRSCSVAGRFEAF